MLGKAECKGLISIERDRHAAMYRILLNFYQKLFRKGQCSAPHAPIFSSLRNLSQ